MKRFYSLASVVLLAVGISAAQTSSTSGSANTSHKHSKSTASSSDASQPKSGQSQGSDVTSNPNSAANPSTDAGSPANQDTKDTKASAPPADNTPRDNGVSDTSATPNRAESKGSGNWGWIGLFGLLGLLPRGNKDRSMPSIRTSGDTGTERIRRVG